jgi:hypothetical protein
MKPLKIRYAKAVCLSILYILLVSAVYVAVSKLAGLKISIDGITLNIACCGILLHFMDKENKEKE